MTEQDQVLENEENDGQAAKKRKTCAKKVDIDTVPARGKVQVYDQRLQAVQLKFRNDQPKKCKEYKQNRHDRQGSRTDFTNGLLRHMYQYKMVTNDDSLCVMRSKEKGYEKFYTTSCDLIFTNSTFSFGSPRYAQAASASAST